MTEGGRGQGQAGGLPKNGVEDGQGAGTEEGGDDDEEDGAQRRFIGWMQVDNLCFCSRRLSSLHPCFSVFAFFAGGPIVLARCWSARKIVAVSLTVPC